MLPDHFKQKTVRFCHLFNLVFVLT